MSITIHTTMGEIKAELYCTQAPRTCFNFLALAASGAYNSSMFHRNIPGFMIQGGAPGKKGKGGESIWGGDFPDEFHQEVVHDR